MGKLALSPISFTTKVTKGSDNFFPNFVLFVSFVVNNVSH
jgi:hypothetical protein